MKRNGKLNSHVSFLTLAIVVLLSVKSAELRAAPKSADDALLVVEGWLFSSPTPLGEILGQRVAGVETYADTKGTTLYHVVSLEPAGFVVVAADDLIEPIIAFANDGIYQASDDHPLGAMVNKDLSQRLAKIHEAQQEERTQVHSLKMRVPSPSQKKWGRLQRFSYDLGGVEKHVLEEGQLHAIDDVCVLPLTQSKWSQSLCTYEPRRACYNYYTPRAYWVRYPDEYGVEQIPGDADNFLAGCVATALAQVMYYHQHPQESIGMIDFEVELKLPLDDGSDHIVDEIMMLRGGDGQGGPYRWDLMVLDPNDSTTEPQCQAIGALCYDAGVAINMTYGENGSGAYTSKTADALQDTFLYANAIKGRNVTYDSYGGTWTWHNIGPGLNAMVNPNLDAGFPVILAIRRPGGGHAVVADGYGYQHTTLYHHLNMGWNGFDDAWYNLPDVSATYRTYTVINQCVYNIFPSHGGEIISGRVTDRFGRPIKGVRVEITIPVALGPTRFGQDTMTIVDSTNERGIYAFVGIPSNTSCTIAASKGGHSFSARDVSTGTSKDYGNKSGNVWGINFAEALVQY